MECAEEYAWNIIVRMKWNELKDLTKFGFEIHNKQMFCIGLGLSFNKQWNNDNNSQTEFSYNSANHI